MGKNTKVIYIYIYKKAILHDLCKKIEGNNRDLFKKIRVTKGTCF